MLATLKLVQTSAKQQLRYRVAMLAGMATNIAWGVFRYFLIGAFYLQESSINGFSQEAAATYVPLTQSLMVVLTIFGSMEIGQAVRQGDITTILMRPMGFLRYWLGYYGGKSIVNLFVRALPLLLIFYLFFPIQLPGSWQHFILFCLSISFSWFLSHLWIILINMSAFWLTDASGLFRMVFALQQLLSGMLFPLRMFPDWFQQLCAFTPFPGMMNTPIEIFTTTVSISEAWGLIFQQMGWLLALTIFTHIVYRAGIRQLEINGG